jgi:hypothetical protein
MIPVRSCMDNFLPPVSPLYVLSDGECFIDEDGVGISD